MTLMMIIITYTIILYYTINTRYYNIIYNIYSYNYTIYCILRYCDVVMSGSAGAVCCVVLCFCHDC